MSLQSLTNELLDSSGQPEALGTTRTPLTCRTSPPQGGCGETATTTATGESNPRSGRALPTNKQVNVNTRDRWQRTPLAVAAETGGPDAVRALLESGQADVNARDMWQRTALAIAAEIGNVDTLRALLETEQVDVNAKDMWDKTPLIQAAESGNLDVVKVLLESREVDVNAEDTWDRTALWIAAGKARSDIVRALLSRKDIEVNPQRKGYGFNKHETPLAIACYYGNAPVVQELLADGRVDINARDKEGLTPVHLSVSNFSNNVLSLLLAQPSLDALAPCDTGHTPLHTAAVCGNLNAFRQLLHHPHVTDPNIMTEDNWTPLGLAARFGRDGIVRALMEDGRVDVNEIAGEGQTALVLAAKMMWFDAVQELLRAEGVDVHKRGAEDGMSFAELVEGGNNSTLKMLLRERVTRECH